MLNLVSLKDRLAHFWPAERGRGWPVTKGLFVARDYRYFYAVQFILVCIFFFFVIWQQDWGVHLPTIIHIHLRNCVMCLYLISWSSKLFLLLLVCAKVRG